MADKLKVKEITISLSGVISNGPYENLRPGFSMTVEPANGESPNDVFNSGMEQLHTLMALEENRAKTELIASLYSSIKWYDKDGKRYPSVTSVIGYEDRHTKFGRFTDEQLSQYASRGNIIEAVIEEYLRTGEWIAPEDIPSLTEDVFVIKDGSLGFDLNQCSHKEVMEHFRDKIVVEEFQKEVFNEDFFYAGTLDIIGKYEGKRSVIDIKCGTFDWRQLAAYAMCLDGVEQLVILAVGPTDNKCGYQKPKCNKLVQIEFEEFLKARAKFKRRFGV